VREIRPILAEEADDFLRLICLCFDLDFTRARAIFFSEPFFDLSRKWALFEGGRMEAILTTTPLVFGWGRAIGIAGVASRPESRGRGLATELLAATLSQAERAGERAAMLFARRRDLYQRVGFEPIDVVIKGPIRPARRWELGHSLGMDSVQALYGSWAEADERRLRRDEQRWRFWNFSLRHVEAQGDGYLCSEGSVVREALLPGWDEGWPVANGTEWVGLAGLTDELGVPLTKRQVEMEVLGYRIPDLPRMFLTDQF
jgi:GNAT superfamily N-acetyltransferase